MPRNYDLRHVWRAVLLPYVLASIIITSGLRDRFLRNFVLSISVVTVTTLWEARMGENLFSKIFVPLFNGQGEGWHILSAGLARVASSLAATLILAGLVFMFAFRLQNWLEASNRVGALSSSNANSAASRKPRILTLWTFLALFLTWVRGPQIGTFLAWLFSLMGRGKKPRLRARIMFAAIVIVGIPGAIQSPTIMLPWDAPPPRATVRKPRPTERNSLTSTST